MTIPGTNATTADRNHPEARSVRHFDELVEVAQNAVFAAAKRYPPFLEPPIWTTVIW